MFANISATGKNRTRHPNRRIIGKDYIACALAIQHDGFSGKIQYRVIFWDGEQLQAFNGIYPLSEQIGKKRRFDGERDCLGNRSVRLYHPGPVRCQE